MQKEDYNFWFLQKLRISTYVKNYDDAVQTLEYCFKDQKFSALIYDYFTGGDHCFAMSMDVEAVYRCHLGGFG